MRERRSGRVLLQLHDWPHEPHWACPGGGVERSETVREAAARELHEETGRSDSLGAELFVWEHAFRFAGAPVRQRETYFLAEADETRLPVSAPDLDDGIVHRAWLTIHDITALEEAVWPPDLLARLREAYSQDL